jgi:hypothetical protein
MMHSLVAVGSHTGQSKPTPTTYFLSTHHPSLKQLNMDGEWAGNTDCVPVTVEVLIFYTMNLEHLHWCSVFLTSKSLILYCFATPPMKLLSM